MGFDKRQLYETDIRVRELLLLSISLRVDRNSFASCSRILSAFERSALQILAAVDLRPFLEGRVQIAHLTIN